MLQNYENTMPQLSYLHVIWAVILELYKWKWNSRSPFPKDFKSGKSWRKKELHQMVYWWQLVFWICECLTSFGVQKDWTVWPAQPINHADRAASITTDKLENDTGLCKAEQQYNLGQYSFFYYIISLLNLYRTPISFDITFSDSVADLMLCTMFFAVWWEFSWSV